MALNLVGTVSLDGSGFERGLKRMGSSVGSDFKNIVAGAFSMAAITQAVRGTIDWASKLNDVADNLEVNVEWLQKMGNAASLVGSNIEDVGKFIATLFTSRQAAINAPQGGQARAFSNLGINSDQVMNLSSQKMVEQIARNFAAGAGSVADLAIVGGRSARKLAEAFRTQFETDIPIVSAALINELDDLGDRFTVLATLIKVGMSPAIIWVMTQLERLVGLLRQAASGLGAFSAGFEDNGKFMDRPIWNTIGPGLYTSIWRGIKGGWKDMQTATVNEESDQINTSDLVESAKKRRASAKKTAQDKSPGFSPYQNDYGTMKAVKDDAVKSSLMPASDALLAVGNFLGGGRSMVDSIATQQLAVAQEQLVEQKSMNEQLKAIKEQGVANAGSGGIEIGNY